MAGERSRRRSRHQLGDSWVVESDEDIGNPDEGGPRSTGLSAHDTNFADNTSEEFITAPSSTTSRRRTPRNSARDSSEPELVMPSIHEDSVDGSWLAADGRSSRAQARRRAVKPAAQASPRAARPSRTYANRTTQKASQRDERRSPSEGFAETVVGILQPIFSGILDVFGGAIKILKPFISYAIAIYLLLGLMLLLRNLLTRSVHSALSPLCRIPGSSLLNLPMCHSPVSVDYKGEQTPPVEFDQLMTVQSKFEEVLEESAGGVSLPLDMKRGETSIRDLRQVVRFSQLHSKNELVLEFDGFIETARIASYDLQKFNSHVGRGVDNILATARWTKRVLDGIAARDGSRGALQSFINHRVLAPFQPLKFTEDALLDQYIQHTRIVEDEIHRLIAEAQALLLVLQNLEDRLDVIHGIATRDNNHAQLSMDEILSQLWTQLGGNRSKLGKYDSQLRLLQQVGEYRRTAWAHVSGTILKLQAMGAELEELRERVGSAELLRDRAHVPLSVHIENIELGVERLETGRNQAKRVENEYLRKTLERGKDDERLLVVGSV